MNFDHLQDAWNNEEGPQKDFDLSVTTIKKANQPIDKIRKNMKHELYYQLLALLVIALVPMLYHLSPKELITFYTLFVILLIISFYYFYRFYSLFNKMHEYNVSLKDNLFELYYEIRLHIEMYKSFSFLLLPFIIFLTGILLYSSVTKKMHSGHGSWTNSEWLFYLGAGIFLTLFMIVATNWWVNRFYGKYVGQIKEILEQLKE